MRLVEGAVMAAAACALAGCASLARPELTSPDVLPLRVLTQAIECELAASIADQVATNRWLLSWQGQYTITLKANQVGFLRATTNTLPIVLPRSSVLNLGLGGGATAAANRTALYKYNVEFADVARRPACTAAIRPDGHPFLAGEIGFGSWMARAIDASGGGSGRGKPDGLVSIGHTFEFSIDLNAAVSPSFVLMPVPAATINPSVGFERVEDNIVEVSFGKAPVAPATVTKTLKVPSARQRKEITDARGRLNAALETAARAERALTREDRAQLEASDKAETLERALTRISPQGLTAQEQSDKTKLGAELETALKAIDRTRIVDLKRRRDEIAAAQRRAREEGEDIARIEANPERTDVTTRQAAVPAVGVPPDANPNVSGTLLQLQLERLVGNRLGGL